MCGFNLCEIISLLSLVIFGAFWALIWTKELHFLMPPKTIHTRQRYIILGLFEASMLIIFLCVVIRSRRRNTYEKLRERASRILHSQSDYGSIERGENKLYFIQERFAEMDKDELKRFRESLITRQSQALYPELSEENNQRASISSSTALQSKVKVRVLKSSCSTRSPMLMKILLVGNPNTGKTSLLGRWVHGQFKDSYKPTLGADFVAANLELDSDGVKLTSLSLQAWDIAGQERFASMTNIYYNKAVCFCVVYDISNRSTLQGALWWIRDIQSKFDKPYIVVLANKLDLKDHQKILPDDLAILDSTDGLEFYEVSAKTGENVDEVFRKVVLNTILVQIQRQIEQT